MKKLIIYGDSILRGVTYSSEEGRHRLCRGYKLERLGSVGFDITNRARMGATVCRGLEILRSTLEECTEGAIVLFEFGGNDCDYEWSEIADCPVGTHAPHVPKPEFLRTYREAIRLAKDAGATVLVSTLVPICAEDYLRTITKGRNADNICRWLGDTSMLYRYQEHYNTLVEKLAAEEGVPTVDLRQAFLLSHRYTTLISADGIHPTEEGHDLIENTLCRELKKYA